MPNMTFYEFIYYGLVIASLLLYLPLYIKRRHEIVATKRSYTRWGIVISYACIGVIGVAVNLVNWLPALVTTVISCALAYYVVFIKYKV
ncbi:hypothetical protein [Sporomusa sp.]|uniref:hypothetical protein n=1 Tax=Sporomusa sp. TaxID=2078658 RepID=UPI002BA7BED3|nr:hypothetical protein [Sporomusa sp.]MDF2876772.1 hypothetical protein [Sporomusa sp.]HWR05548.1 hypothetical protein [Sporomusa sp.]